MSIKSIASAVAQSVIAGAIVGLMMTAAGATELSTGTGVCRNTSDAGRQCTEDLGNFRLSTDTNVCRNTSDAGRQCTEDLGN